MSTPAQSSWDDFAAKYPYYRNWEAAKKAQEDSAYRAFNRGTCCKSRYTFRCYSCGEMVQPGDKITKTYSRSDGMVLRSGYPLTGTTRWVHVGCIPCYWFRGGNGGIFDNGYGPDLMTVWTEWDAKLYSEFETESSNNEGLCYDKFLEDKGYPAEKPMVLRIKRGLIKFQALWRGYLCKKALPIALEQARRKAALYAWFKPDKFNAGEGTLYHSLRKREKVVPNQPENQFDIGDLVECPFDVGTFKESIHQGMIVHGTYLLANEHRDVKKDGWQYLVNFKDGETLLYPEKTLIKRISQVKAIKESMARSGKECNMDVQSKCTYTDRFQQGNTFVHKLLVKQGKFEDVDSDFYLYRLVASGQLKSYSDDY